MKPEPDYVDKYPYRFTEFYQAMSPPLSERILCHYGQPGDLLYVRESFANTLNGFQFKANYTPEEWKKIYDVPFKPSIHMPKAAARIWLEITDVRVETLTDITEKDCIYEGIKDLGYSEGYTHTALFVELWESIHGKESFWKNPWVWVISFKVLSTTGKPQQMPTNANECQPMPTF